MSAAAAATAAQRSSASALNEDSQSRAKADLLESSVRENKLEKSIKALEASLGEQMGAQRRLLELIVERLTSSSSSPPITDGWHPCLHA